MKMKSCKSILFYSIFLSVICFASNSQYWGTNIVTRDIEFTLKVEDSLLVGTAEDLNFGDIIKGSTDIRKAETKIIVKAGTDVNYVAAKYETGEVQSDGSQKIEINYKEGISEEQVKIKKIREGIKNEGSEKIDVYFLPFEEKYQLKIGNLENEGEIPVKAEIRGIGDAKLGKYEGIMQINLIAVTNNKDGVVEE